MSPFLAGFADELTKVAVLGGLGKLVAKHPIKTLGAGALVGLTGYSAAQGYKRGKEPGEKPRYLMAGKEGPSPVYSTNYHQLFEHELKPHERKKLSENFKPDLVRR